MSIAEDIDIVDEEIENNEDSISVIEIDKSVFDGDLSSFIKSHCLKSLEYFSKNETSSVEFFNEDSTILFPTEDPVDLCIISEKIGRLSACINIMADCTVGLGYELHVKPRFLRSSEFRSKIDEDKDLLDSFLEDVNPDIDFIDIMRMIKIDEETTGNGYMEVVRDSMGLPIHLNYLPSHTMRISKNRLFVQCRNNKKLYFKKYGDPRSIDALTGLEISSPKIPATEVIHFKLHSASSSFYGSPRWIPVLNDIYSNILAKLRNTVFLENDSVPRLFVIVHNGQLSADSKNFLRRLFERDLKGGKNKGKTVVLEMKETKNIGGTVPNQKIEIMPLSVGLTEEASFLKLIEKGNEEIREAFRIASSFFTSEGANRSNSSELKQITIETVFAPEARRYASILNKTIVRDLGIETIKIAFRLPSKVSDLDQSMIDSRYAATGAYTMDDMRRKVGLEPYPDGNQFSSLPLSLVLAAFNKGTITLFDGKEFANV